MAKQSVSFSDQVRAFALTLGFDSVAIARAGPGVVLDRDCARYEAFLREGMHGEMDWLARSVVARSRLDGDEILEGARSVVCVARRYPFGEPHPSRSASAQPARASAGPREQADDGDASRTIARYARGHDYHRFLRRRVRRLATFLRSLGTPEAPVQARPLIDDKPVLERAWAARAGLGFIGKNGMLIVPGLGSMVLLGEVVTTLDLIDESRTLERSERADSNADEGAPMSERCGTCTRCLEACPTGAFPRPFVLDARRCVSYLTIEHPGPIPGELREGVGEHLFGCDDCQTVCPFNAGEGARAAVSTADGDPFAPLERWSTLRLQDLLAHDRAASAAATEGSPLRRAGRARLARNAAIVLGNRRDAEALPALEYAATHHDDAVVREAARWAAERVHGKTGRRES